MMINNISEIKKAIRSQPKTKEAAISRLQKAGIIDKSGKLVKLYQTKPCIAKKG